MNSRKINTQNYASTIDTQTAGQNIYTGMRYVPIFDDEWSNEKAYDPLTIVDYTDELGNKATYISKWFVEIGVKPTDTTYWMKVFDFVPEFTALSEQVNNLSSIVSKHLQESSLKFQGYDNQIDTINSELKTLDSRLTAVEALTEGGDLLNALVTEFGADNTGASDCSSAINSMLDKYGFVCFFNGNFKIENEIVPNADCTFYNIGSTVTGLNIGKNSKKITLYFMDGVLLNGVNFKSYYSNITLKGNNTSAMCYNSYIDLSDSAIILFTTNNACRNSHFTHTVNNETDTEYYRAGVYSNYEYSVIDSFFENVSLKGYYYNSTFYNCAELPGTLTTTATYNVFSHCTFDGFKNFNTSNFYNCKIKNIKATIKQTRCVNIFNDCVIECLTIGYSTLQIPASLSDEVLTYEFNNSSVKNVISNMSTSSVNTELVFDSDINTAYDTDLQYERTLSFSPLSTWSDYTSPKFSDHFLEAYKLVTDFISSTNLYGMPFIESLKKSSFTRGVPVHWEYAYLPQGGASSGKAVIGYWGAFSNRTFDDSGSGYYTVDVTRVDSI